MEENEEFRRLLDMAAAFHGHLCGGQVLGVRIAMLGLRELGITDPRGEDRKKITVFVEVNRCAADAIMTVTGCRVGKRSFKAVDYGRPAATFMNLETGRAVRVALLPDVMTKIAAGYVDLDRKSAEKKAYGEMADRELFRLQEVRVKLKEEDTPGTPVTVVCCDDCGELVLDNRHVVKNGGIFCRPCAAQESYYTPLEPPGRRPGDK